MASGAGPTDFLPPPSMEIARRQNDDTALRLLIAQRRLYSRAKRWLAIRWIGMLILGIAAPAASVVWPEIAVAAGSIAGLWLFVGRTFVVQRHTAETVKAAAVQEQFDFYVFGMHGSIERSSMPSLEDIALLAGPKERLRSVAEAANLVDWYPIKLELPGITTVAISQRANASYSDRLLRTTATIWGVALTCWIVIVVVASLVADLSLATFLLGIVFPVLPAFLDVAQYRTGIRRQARERADLARAIEDRLGQRDQAVAPADLLVWQDQLFHLRCSTADVPDFIYRIMRPKNEQAMHAAADHLAGRDREAEE